MLIVLITIAGHCPCAGCADDNSCTLLGVFIVGCAIDCWVCSLLTVLYIAGCVHCWLCYRLLGVFTVDCSIHCWVCSLLAVLDIAGCVSCANDNSSKLLGVLALF